MEIMNRKGIYQAIDPKGNVIADERWQVIALTDGAIQIDNETVRVAPFDEPRSDSVTLTLEPDLRLRELSIHGLFGKRESRVCISSDRTKASACWRHVGEVKEKWLPWREDIELDYFSPLFNMATVWRSKLQPNQSRKFDCVLIDAVNFKPEMMQQVYTNLGKESHSTRFGSEMLWHYTLGFGGQAENFTHFWCDDDGVLLDFVSSSGYKFVLTAKDVKFLE
jgi:hypothetical protein